MQQSMFQQETPTRAATLAVVQSLKDHQQDHEFYPTTDAQIAAVVADIRRLTETFDVTDRDLGRSVLDIGAGDGRVVLAICNALNANKREHEDRFKPFAIEKAAIHINQYAGKDITLLGTEFYETNLISKKATFAFVNPPYSDFSNWIARIIETLRFNICYAIIPTRWEDDERIKAAMKTRNLQFSKVLAESDFEDGHRQARAKVHLVRFSFMDVCAETIDAETEERESRFKGSRRHWRPSLNKNVTCPFQLFIENELGLRKTHSDTTEKFHEYSEKERIRKAMDDTESESYALVKSAGILAALLDNYDRDMERVLAQYKLISTIDGALLSELGVKHESILEGVKAKLLGYRNVYWQLLFDQLTVLKEKLIGTHKERLLNTLSANNLDFTYTNAVYVINYAVELANGLIEESLVDVFKNLTDKDSIKTYYKSNEHVYKDRWHFNNSYEDGATFHRKCKRELDYRFVHSNYSNFGSNSWDRGLCSGARQFTNDLMVVFRLLGYANLYTTEAYETMEMGDKLSVMGTHPDGDITELVVIRFYKNGNRHMKWNQEAMMRFNVTVSRVLGWVRNKGDFETETDQKKPVSEAVWAVSDDMKVLPSHVLRLTQAA